MKTEIINVPTMTIQEFAEKHDLVMEIRERERPSEPMMRYFASFRNAETKRGSHGLCGTLGNGPSPAFAVKEYAHAISLETLVVDAMRKTRRVIRVPRLSSDPNWRAI